MSGALSALNGVSIKDGSRNGHTQEVLPGSAKLHQDHGGLNAEEKSFTATFLVADVRGWGEIVHALGPEPGLAAEMIRRFWDSAAPAIEETGGQVYAWRGDGLLVAYQGRRRMEQALKAADRLLAIVRTELAPGFWPQLRAANARTLQFAIAVAITDGKAVPVSVRFGAQHSDELTGDWVNAAFELVKWAAAGTVGITCEVLRWLARHSPATLNAFAWDGPEEVLLAGASRPVCQGVPIGVPVTAASSRPGVTPTLPAS
jgi:class 3 adenylate cyclase